MVEQSQPLSPLLEQRLLTMASRKKLDASMVNAINLLAIDAYHKHHYTQAVNHWNRLLTLFPVNSPDSKDILKMIALAQKKQLNRG